MLYHQVPAALVLDQLLHKSQTCKAHQQCAYLPSLPLPPQMACHLPHEPQLCMHPCLFPSVTYSSPYMSALPDSDLQMARHLLPAGAIKPEEWSFFLGRPGVDMAPGSGPQKVCGRTGWAGGFLSILMIPVVYVPHCAPCWAASAVPGSPSSFSDWHLEPFHYITLRLSPCSQPSWVRQEAGAAWSLLAANFPQLVSAADLGNGTIWGPWASGAEEGAGGDSADAPAQVLPPQAAGKVGLSSVCQTSKHLNGECMSTSVLQSTTPQSRGPVAMAGDMGRAPHGMMHLFDPVQAGQAKQL
jgi:hypothetical protein